MTRILAVPGVPHGISAAEISQLLDTICIILVTWDPPANSDLSDIAQYNSIILSVTSRNITVESNISASESVHSLCVPNCRDMDDVSIQVAAVNQYGCKGPIVEVQATAASCTSCKLF